MSDTTTRDQGDAGIEVFTEGLNEFAENGYKLNSCYSVEVVSYERPYENAGRPEKVTTILRECVFEKVDKPVSFGGPR